MDQFPKIWLILAYKVPILYRHLWPYETVRKLCVAFSINNLEFLSIAGSYQTTCNPFYNYRSGEVRVPTPSQRKTFFRKICHNRVVWYSIQVFRDRPKNVGRPRIMKLWPCRQTVPQREESRHITA